MTTTYHDAIINGAPANASTFNAPLGQLDAALLDLVGRALQEAQVSGVAQSGAIKINFAGAGVSGSYNAGTKTLTLTIPGAAGSAEAHVIQEDAVSVATRSRLNFLSAGGLSVTDNAGNDSSDVSFDFLTALQGQLGNADLLADSTQNGLLKQVSATAGRKLASDGADQVWIDDDFGINIVIGDGVNVVSTGVKGYIQIPFDGVIASVRLVADASGSIVVDVWRDTYANFPPTVADTITASAKPTLSSAQKAEDSTLTGWTKTLTKGDWLAFNIDSATTVKQVTLSILGRKTATA